MPHTLPVPLTESPRRTPEEARTALLAIAKRSPWIIDPETVDMLLSNVSHVGAMLCALGSNYSTPGCDDFDLVQVLLGHLAGVYFEAGKRSAALKTGCAFSATLPDGTTVLLPVGTEISIVDKPDPIAESIAYDIRTYVPPFDFTAEKTRRA